MQTIHPSFPALATRQTSQKAMDNCVPVVKLFITLALFITFVLFFGLPSIGQFLVRDIVVNTKIESSRGGVPPPAITVCSLDILGGWKTQVLGGNSTSLIDQQCSDHPQNIDGISQCVRDRTYNLTETVLNTSVYSTIDFSMEKINSSMWRSDLTMTLFGQCHTLNYNKQLGKKPIVFYQL